MDSSHWKLMIAGGLEEFLNIYHSHYRFLFTYSFSLTANRDMSKDCLQELFLELWDNRATQNPDVKDVRSYLMTWLRRKISLECKVRNRKMLDDGLLFKSLPESSDAYEELLIAFQQTEEDKKKLHTALKRLTPQQLEIIRLRYFEKLSFSQIADQTSLSPRTIYNLMYEATRMLRKEVAFPFF